MKKKIIPDIPAEPVIITSEVEERLRSWVVYLQSVSPRILVRCVLDKEFNIEIVFKGIKTHLYNGNEDINVKFDNLQPQDVCMYVIYNSALKEDDPPQYLTKNLLVFCYHDKAFFVQYGFDRNDFDENDADTRVYSADFYNWENRVKIFLDFFREFIKRVPPLKKPS